MSHFHVDKLRYYILGRTHLIAVVGLQCDVASSIGVIQDVEAVSTHKYEQGAHALHIHVLILEGILEK